MSRINWSGINKIVSRRRFAISKRLAESDKTELKRIPNIFNPDIDATEINSKQEILTKKINLHRKMVKEKIKFVDKHWNYGPDDTIVIFSGSRNRFPGIGKPFMSNKIYYPVLHMACHVYGSEKLFEHNSFTARSMQNLVWNLCSYRHIYEHEQQRYNGIKAAIGFGIGEIAACVVTGVLQMEHAFKIVATVSRLIEAEERKMPSALAMVHVNKFSRLKEACKDARSFMERTLGYEYEDNVEGITMTDPVTQKVTTVQIAAYYCHGHVLVGGHPIGLKFLLSNREHYRISYGYILRNQPALNTDHFSRTFERTEDILSNEMYDTADPKFPVYTSTSRHSRVYVKNQYHTSSLYDMRAYSAKSALRNIRKVLTSAPINWHPMINSMFNDFHGHHGTKMNHRQMPRMIDCGVGGVNGLQFVQNFGPSYFEMDKYYWLNVGENENYLRKHSLLRTRYKDRPPGSEYVDDPFLSMLPGGDPTTSPHHRR